MKQTITTIHCDRCNFPVGSPFSIPGGSRVDASGNNDSYDYVADLCACCTKEILQYLLNHSLPAATMVRAVFKRHESKIPLFKAE